MKFLGSGEVIIAHTASSGINAGRTTHTVSIIEMSELVDCAAIHFASEERLMAPCQVSHLAQHRDVHRRLLEDIRHLGVYKSPPSVSLMLRCLRE